MQQLAGQLEAMAKELAALKVGAAQAGLAPKPRLRSFRGVKFSGKDGEFEAFLTSYDAARTLDAAEFAGWNEKDKVAYLVSAVEGKALEVVRASIMVHKNALVYQEVLDDLAAAYRNSAEGEQALKKLQEFVQSKDLETYIREFNFGGTGSRSGTVGRGSTQEVLHSRAQEGSLYWSGSSKPSRFSNSTSNGKKYELIAQWTRQCDVNRGDGHQRRTKLSWLGPEVQPLWD